MMRPYPPEDLATFSDIEMADSFIPAPDVLDWLRDTFLDEGSELFNVDHAPHSSM
ncbi:hypothetical protein [Sphingobium yanoikuyae]|uniref:hypothetical protein n=1 Tax=Sphingobium yanoikuyae TaxID=13690 RepID=UPI0012DA277A|nr:hypothetical protein [Sphingobium yanoikuyae]